MNSFPPSSKPPSVPFPAVPSPEPLRFPTVDDLLAQAANGFSLHPILQLTNPPPPRPEGLFEDLLRSDPSALAQDALDHPDRYADEARALLTELVQSPRRVSAEERRVLDRATLDLAEYRPPTLPASAPKKRPVEGAPRRQTVEQVVDPLPVPGIDIPEDAAPFWWL